MPCRQLILYTTWGPWARHLVAAWNANVTRERVLKVRKARKALKWRRREQNNVTEKFRVNYMDRSLKGNSEMKVQVKMIPGR